MVIGYGLSERLLPGVVDLTESAKAFGRLEQPITYWNAEGALAAIGLVLCARLAGARDRPTAVRALAAAAAVPLGLGVYLSYSRGAIAAALVGLVVLLAAAPTWSQLRATALAVAGSVVAAACAAAFSGVASLSGSLGDREADGAAMLAILIVLMAAAGALQLRLVRRRGARHGGDGAHAERHGAYPPWRRQPSPSAWSCSWPVGSRNVAAATTRSDAAASPASPRSSRVATTTGERASTPTASTRYAALEQAAFEWNGFESVRSARVPSRCTRFRSRCSSSWGCPVCSGSALMVGGVAVAGRRALRRNPLLAPGACAVATVWLLHASIDWDWQLPAVTLPALIAAGALIAAAEQPVRAATERSAGSVA